MKINPTTHFLVAEGKEKIITNKVSPNQKNLTTSTGLPQDLVIHYTAGGLAGTLATFLKAGGTSAHLVIDTNGDIYQMVAFNRQAYHAGYSVWDTNSSFNGRAVGIELINYGWDVKNVPPTEVVTATHKHKFNTQKKWQKYPEAQMKSLYAVSKALIHFYDLNRFLGHDDISAGRKQDPGPAFSWDDFKRNVLGQTNNIGKVFKVKSPDGTATLRKADSSKSEALQSLPNGFEVGLMETWNNWSHVYLVNNASDVVYSENGTQMNRKTMGWIRSDLIALKA